MGLFGKKKDEKIEETPKLPDLPEWNNLSLPSLPSENIESPPGLQSVEVNELPLLPNANEERAGREKIKNAIVNSGMQDDKFNPLIRNTRPVIESPSIEEHKEISDVKLPRRTKVTEPIYVRLDKFETTVEAFEGIRDKVAEIEKLLNKIREIKVQEEKELVEWENEIQIIKARIEAIDRDVFGKLD